MSFDTADDKFAYDATDLFADAIRRLGRTPRILVTDKLTGFRTGCRNAMNTRGAINTLHVVGASINGKHVNNNIHERCNGDLAALIRNARGFRSDTPRRLSWHVTYHNFFKPHPALHGKTPAEASGIHIPGSDKLLGLIRAAVASRFNFA